LHASFHAAGRPFATVFTRQYAVLPALQMKEFRFIARDESVDPRFQDIFLSPPEGNDFHMVTSE